MAITDWPQTERPREKLLQQGPAALSNAELLAIFLRTGIKGHTAVDLARQMLGQFDGLRGLFSSSLEEFSELPGMGSAKYAQLQAVLELSRRHLAEKMQREDTLTDPSTARTYLKTRLRDYPYEVFACLFLDNRHRVIAFEELFRGTINGASVHPREVVRRCLSHNAAAVILAHNHPSGVAEPSEADRNLTRKLGDTLGMVDVRVLDHIIVGDGETVSFSERGLI